MSAPAGYTRTQIALHWIVAILIVLQFVLHDGISHAFRAVMRGTEISFDPLVASHVFGGLAVLAFALWRLALKAKNGVPQPPEEEAPALKLAAKVTHLSLYGLMILVPVTGAVAWFGMNHDAGEVHEVLRIPLLLLVLLHVAGALYHQFVLKTGVMNRMRRPVA